MGQRVLMLFAMMVSAVSFAQTIDSTDTLDSLQLHIADSTSIIETLLGVSPGDEDTTKAVVQDSFEQDSLVTPMMSQDPDTSLHGILDTNLIVVDSSDIGVTDSVATFREALSMESSSPAEPLDLSLDYGYKGYPWGVQRSSIPPVTSWMSPLYSRDSSSVSYWSTLGPDTVLMSYFYSDSGFWKVEISFPLDPFDQDSHDKKFKDLSQILDQLYGNPTSSSFSVSGPMTTSSNPLDMDYSKMYQHRSWQSMPCQIELLLISYVQDTETIFPVLSGTSQLVLAYYNPDYMIRVKPSQPVDNGPSIFDLY